MNAHLHIDLKKAIKWPDEMLSGMIKDKTASEVRDYLKHCYYIKEYNLMPIGNCSNFDHQKDGCRCKVIS